MKLQTKIPLEKRSNNLINYKSNIVLLGSCFSENIAKKLDYFKFQNLQNPFGILFHPRAIETLISNAVINKEYSEEEVFFHNEQWHCFDAHSKLSNALKENLIQALNSKLSLTSAVIQNSTHIIITLGTAWVYRDVKTNSIVANCHKVPQKQFKKELLSVEDITNSLKNILSLIRRVNNNAFVVFTVSPIRHTKDGFVENTQSKAHLITAIHKVISNQSFYFPSYEILMDELRDYRFYKDDMIHPNQLAINYIWEKFKTVWISDASFRTMDEVDTIQKGLQHKPFNSKSQAHQEFLQKLEAKKNQLHVQFPHIVF
ncbi:MAG: GSCFA domain-containing protein [Algibacter sp.]|uniref:GSCFA domain-containing protein n=1 Tax=Algibacter sp. TaxID=1872428 RepID=UPI002606CEFC|nr:GSCFA domain-containing protein [Algibacter sp.]MDG1730684.1 GSCFA domain-containing protein [Algibacter sp.]MDG2177635.1 GSCFA domain-containing protein [Algibacter sp.]